MATRMSNLIFSFCLFSVIYYVTFLALFKHFHCICRTNIQCLLFSSHSFLYKPTHPIYSIFARFSLSASLLSLSASRGNHLCFNDAHVHLSSPRPKFKLLHARLHWHTLPCYTLLYPVCFTAISSYIYTALLQCPLQNRNVLSG